MENRLLSLVATTVLGTVSAYADDARSLYNETKTTVEQWVETENLISEEENKWRVEEALLTDTLALLRSEKKELEAKLETLNSSASVADEKRSALLEEKESLEDARSVLEGSLGKLESDLKGVLPQLPTHFVEGASAVIRRIPEDSQATKQSISQRMRNIVAVLSQASKFDNTISLEREVRGMSDGSSKEVSTLYFGFALAYFADLNGEYAGYGYPEGDGWQWVEAKEYGTAILDAIAMYEKNKQAAFVSLPVTIK
ncbi:MAG: DUF3450 family protein [Verrucomicrobiota bacterium]